MLRLRLFLLCLVAGSIVLQTPEAFAWLDLRISGDDVEIRVDSDGTALVTHRMMLRVRGGPMKGFTVSGVDADAIPEPEATLTRAKSGRAAGAPLALVPSREGDQLRFELVYKRGVFTGVYLAQFSYRTDFKSRGLLSVTPDGAELLWTGPDFADGVDSLRAEFSFPRAEVPPRLASGDADELGLSTQDDGVFLSQLRREGERDVFVLTRPHAAKNERVKWRVHVDPNVFGLESKPTQVDAEAEPRLLSPVKPVRRAEALRERWLIAAGVLMSIVFVALVMFKSRARGLRFLVKLRRVWRVPLLLLAAWGSLAFSVVWELPTAAAVLLVACLLLSVQLPKPRALAARGPGQWSTASFASLRLPQARLGGPAWLDVGRPVGALLFAGLFVGCVVLSLRLLGSAPYYSAMALVYGCAWVPIFCTLGSVPPPALEVQRTRLSDIQKLLSSKGNLDVQEIARFVAQGGELTTACGSEPDELRLRVSIPRVRAGFVDLEIGVEQNHGLLGAAPVPVVIVRVRDNSTAHGALPRSAQWSRGRDSDERVALFRPLLPTALMCSDLVRSLIRALKLPEENVAGHEKNERRRATVAA